MIPANNFYCRPNNFACRRNFACQPLCQPRCQPTCQAQCQFNCKPHCRVHCQLHCQVHCQVHCQQNPQQNPRQRPCCLYQPQRPKLTQPCDNVLSDYDICAINKRKDFGLFGCQDNNRVAKPVCELPKDNLPKYDLPFGIPIINTVNEDPEKAAAAKARAVSLYKSILCNLACGIEYLVTSYNICDIDIKGWGARVSDEIDNYSDALGEFYDMYGKYLNKKPDPQVQILLELFTSAITHYLCKNLFGPTLSSQFNLSNFITSFGNGNQNSGIADNNYSESDID